MPHEIIMPALGMAQDNGVIVAWHKRPGDAVKADDILMEVETDKAVMEVEAGRDGFLAELRAGEGDAVPVGEVVAVISDSADDVKASPAKPDGADRAERPAVLVPVASPPREEPPVPATAAANAPAKLAPADGRVLASPKARYQAAQRGIDLQALLHQGVAEPIHLADLDLHRPECGSGAARITRELAAPVAPPSARRLAREHGVDLAALAAELRRERLSEGDIRTKIGGGVAAKTPGRNRWDVDHAAYGPVETEPVSRFARLAADNLSAAQAHIPAVTHHDRADMMAVEALRNSLAGEAHQRGVKLTALAFHVKALSRTLKSFPRFNASLSADGENLVLKRYVDIGVAVDTPHGLMVPVIRAADRKGLCEIAAEIADLAARSKERRIKPEEMGGASMSITNLGGIGGRHFSPIVNPPEVAILGITRASVEPVWDGEMFQPVTMCPLDLSYDHRVVNGADAARFLAHYAGLLADPLPMLI